MTQPIKINGNFSSSNYYDFGNNLESLNTLHASAEIGAINLSVGVGADTTHKFSPNGSEVTTKPAFESKLKYSINKNLNTQARFRKIGDTEQYRVTFGGSYKFNQNNSIYSSAHLTTKHSPDGWKTNTGAWVGYTHKFDKCSVSAEFQQNIPFNREINSSDSMVNVIFSVPI